MSATNPQNMRIFLGICLIAFGALNQVAQALVELFDPLSLPVFPAGATVLPGVFLVIAGLGASFGREWGLTLGTILCLIHGMISLLFLMNSSSSVTSLSGLMEVVYMAVCVAGAVGAWWILHLSRSGSK